MKINVKELDMPRPSLSLTTNLCIRSARLAAQVHAGQKRDNNGAPYITHLARTAGRLMSRPEATDVNVSAMWLHDFPEDIAETQEEFQQCVELVSYHISPEVAVRVSALTNASKFLKDRASIPRAQRKSMDRVKLAAASHEIKLMKMIDRIDNLQETVSDIERGYDQKLDFASKYADESLLLLEDALVFVDNELEEEFRYLVKRVKFVVRQFKDDPVIPAV